ncbi:LemA family protein [Candidatus Shapirobacteria bacterium]|nr:LemA family protein [Candidatus Shapirobacteria bacterium]
MKKRSSFWVILAVVVVLLVLWLVGFYNGLVTKTQGIDNQWAQVETQYQRRFDLIPNLVNATKGIFTQEQKVFGDLAEARTRYAGATSVDEKAQAAGELESALGRLLVIVENYPELKSDQAVQQLMDDLAGTENRIAVERRRFNDLVKDYNTTIKRIPGNLLAPMMGFSERNYFEAAEGAEKAPEVNL